MKKILIFGAFLGFLACAPALCAVRDGANSASRTKQVRTTATVARTAANSDTIRTVAPTRINATQTRAGTMRTGVIPRAAATQTKTNATQTRNEYVPVSSRVASKTRVASQTTETRTGAAYNQCKSAYFQCMDQFCTLKNDDYRRCSCSSRIYDLVAARNSLTETNEKLTEFTENLDIVGMTAAQATAIRTASDGENALTADTSASKALLTAIMNSIRGEDATVSGKMSSLNSINLGLDTTIGFTTSDDAQIIASYNGTELYSAVYSACRSAVKDDCNDAALQRAVTAYLMAIEQDCNTVQTALGKKQKELKAAIREGGAMLDLARLENRQKHNSDDKATCLTNVENAILSEQVCGANYHKCLDDGKFIDITTGAPIAGVVNFYELANMLSFDTGKSAADQKLAQNASNRTFVKNFEAKTKKFAQDALDRCTEIADDVWQDYLDKALLDIYYAQRTKVDTIKTGCFDFISACYQDREASITAAMASLIDGSSEILLQPDKIVLTTQMCSDYIASCNNMFDDNIINEYIANQTNTDTLAACRAIADQCFTRFGGANYENFYNPSSGLFEPNTADTLYTTNSSINSALDWFTLYAYDATGNRQEGYRSECAKQLAEIPTCVDQIEQAFGGLDLVIAKQEPDWDGSYKYTKPTSNKAYAYGWAQRDSDGFINWNDNDYEFKNRRLRPTGVATEAYNRIIDTLTTQCLNVDGKFVEAQFIDHNRYGSSEATNPSLCKLKTGTCCANQNSTCNNYNYDVNNLNCAYGLLYYVTGGGTGAGGQYINGETLHENMCPKDYMLNVDMAAWGICSCWENGGRRSKNGLASKCMPILATMNTFQDAPCGTTSDIFRTFSASSFSYAYTNTNFRNSYNYWCTQTLNPSTNQVCPVDGCDQIPVSLPLGNGAVAQQN